jgi:dihydrofolate reductase
LRKLTVFNHISLDGYIQDAHGDMSWAHAGADPEWNAFVEGNARGGGTLVFGRITYDLMARYWPTEMARQNDPAVAERMNAMPKIVFSRTLKAAAWNNTRLIAEEPVTAMRRLKREDGDDMAMFGSGTIVAQLAPAGLIDTYQIVINPLILGSGRTMFEGMPAPVRLKQTQVRTFRNGNVVLSYAPA